MKQSGEIDHVLREVARQRDKKLGQAPVFSPARQADLADFIAREFPIEAALRETAMKRDELLRHAPAIPALVKSNLHRQLARGGIRGWRNGAPVWRRLFRSPLGGVLTACSVIIVAILCFGRWEPPSRRNTENFPHGPRAGPGSGVILETELFTRKVAIGPFNLNTNEPASLQASFSPNSGVYLANASEAPLGLRLDLPVRAILTDEGLTRTP